jgi:hypothetical protein
MLTERAGRCPQPPDSEALTFLLVRTDSYLGRNW